MSLHVKFYLKLQRITNFQAAEHGLLLLQQKAQLQRDLNDANELNQKATQENRDLIQELELKK